MMKLHLIFLIPAVLISSYCKGQSDSLAPKKYTKWCISFSGGAAIPVGKFSQFEEIPADDTYGNFNLAGEPQTGIGLNIGCTYMLNKHVGITALLSGASYEAKKKATSDIFGFWHMYNFGEGTTEESGRWNSGDLLAGALYECTKGKISLGMKLMAGAQFARSPDVKLSTTAQQIDAFYVVYREFYQPSMTSIAFAYGVNGYAGYQLCKKLRLMLSAGYSGASHHFGGKSLETKTQYGSSDVQSFNNPIYFNKHISAVSIMLGIAGTF